MIWTALLLAWLVPSIQDRCSIDTGPWWSPVYPLIVQQSYGQAQDPYGIHLGLDLKAPVGARVYAPFTGTIEEVIVPLLGSEYHSKIVLAPKGKALWRARLLHVRGSMGSVGDTGFRGMLIGAVVAWPGHPGEEHVHLEVLRPEHEDARALADPLAFILNRPDGIRPRFQDIVDAQGAVEHGVVFTKDFDGPPVALVALTSPLPQGEVDILVSVTDFISPGPVLMSNLLPVAPARVSAMILKLPPSPYSVGPTFGVVEVFDRSIDLRNELSAATGIYRKSSQASASFSLADHHFVLTHEVLGAYGSWNAQTGRHLLLVSAEDLAGNSSSLIRFFDVQ